MYSREEKKHANTYPIKYQDSIKFHEKKTLSKNKKKNAHESTHLHKKNSV